MRRLICAFVVRIWHKTHFLMARLICLRQNSCITLIIATVIYLQRIAPCRIYDDVEAKTRKSKSCEALSCMRLIIWKRAWDFLVEASTPFDYFSHTSCFSLFPQPEMHGSHFCVCTSIQKCNMQNRVDGVKIWTHVLFFVCLFVCLFFCLFVFLISTKCL